MTHEINWLHYIQNSPKQRTKLPLHIYHKYQQVNTLVIACLQLLFFNPDKT